MIWTPDTHEIEVAARNLGVSVEALLDLRAKLEAGHRVEWDGWENTSLTGGKEHWFYICQKRGGEYVTIRAHSEERARADWETLMRRGHFYDKKSKTRITVPGAR